MKYETPFGTIECTLGDDGWVRLTSNIPFAKVTKSYKSIKTATKKYEELKKSVDQTIKEIKKAREYSISESCYLHRQLKNSMEKGFKKLFLYGPTGTGKTFTAIQTVKELKEKGVIDDYLVVTFSSGMEDIDLLGKFLPDETRVIRFNPSELVEFLKTNIENKTAIIFDEFNRASSKALNILIPLLDGRDNKVIVENFVASEKITIPENNVFFIFTANFGMNYSGTFQLDDAILNRIDVAIFSDYQEEIEKSIMESLPTVKHTLVKNIRDFLREAFKKGMIRPYSTRDLKNTVTLFLPLPEVPTPDEMYEAMLPILHKIVQVSPEGYPDNEFLDEFKNYVKQLV